MSRFSKSLLISASLSVISIVVATPSFASSSQMDLDSITISNSTGRPYNQITSFAALDNQLNGLGKKAAVFFDIDGVLLSEGGPNNLNADLLDESVLTLLKKATEQGIQCFGLTARQPELKIETFKNLEKYGINFDKTFHIDFIDPRAQYYRGILFSPNIWVTKESTKLQTLHAFLDHLAEKNRPFDHVFFIDNEPFHFTDPKVGAISFKQKIQLFEFQREFKPLYTSSGQQAPDLSTLIYKKRIDGGSGGVVVVEDLSGKKWTLKSWKNPQHGINECLGARLYKMMGGHTPEFFLYNDLPSNLRNQQDFTLSNVYRLAEYVEGTQPTDEILKDLVAEYYLPTALISFWDTKPDNYILSNNKELYLIDTGGSFLYRSLGRPKTATDSWSALQVSELSTFTDTSLLAGKVFANINLKRNAEQLKHILSLRPDLLSELDGLCNAAHYEDKKVVRNFLESRLNHLQFLSDFFDGKINTKADPFAMTDSQDAAGTLLYTDINGVTHILFGQRDRHRWWGNLGGGANPGESFSETARRETWEESGNKINLKNLVNQPSHDIIYLEDGFKLRRYRTYLSKIRYGNPQDLQDAEYTAYKWVPVQDILEMLENPKWMTEENTNTLQLADGTILHPPFVESLQQPQIHKWLRDIADKKPVANTCTQSLFGYNHLEPIQEDIETSDADMQRFALWLSGMAQNVPTHKSLIPTPGKDSELLPASYAILDHLSRNAGMLDKADLDTQIRAIIKGYKFADQVDLIKSIISKEQIHQDMNVVYHGLEAESWFMYQVLSQLRHRLNHRKVQTTVLRSLDSFYNELPTPQDLLNYILAGHDNYSLGYKSVGVSCNPSLFSNLANITSSTLNYFFEGISMQTVADRWQIIRTFFDHIGLSNENVLQNFKDIFDRHLTDKPGALLQIFLAPDITNQAVYPAVSMGYALKDCNGNVLRDATEVMNSLRTGEKLSFTEKESIQMRLHADLSRFGTHQVKVYDYFADGNQERLSLIDQAIKDVLNNHMPEVLKKASYQGEIYSSRTPKLVEIMRYHSSINQFELKSDNPITRALVSNDIKKIKELYLRDPSKFNNFTYVDPNSLGICKADDMILAINNELFTEEMSADGISKIVFTLGKAGQQAQSVIQMCKDNKLFTGESSGNEISEVLSTVAQLQEHAQFVIDVCKDNKFITSKTNTYQIAELLRIIGSLGAQAQSVIQVCKDDKLITGKTSESEILSILSAVAEFKDRVQSLIDSCRDNNLITQDMSLLNKIDTYSAVAQLGGQAAEVIQVCKHNKIITEETRGGNIPRILSTMVQFKDQVQSVITICKNNNLLPNGPSVDGAIQTYSTVARLGKQAAEVIQICKNNGLFSKDLTQYDVPQILSAVAQLGEPAQAELIIKLCQHSKLITEKAYGRKISEVLSTVASLGGKAQSVIQLCKDNDLVNEHTSKLELEVILSFVNKLGKRAGSVVQLCKDNNLITPDITTFDVVKILSTVDKLRDQASFIVKLCKDNSLIWKNISVDDMQGIFSAVKELGDQAQFVVEVCGNNHLVKNNTPLNDLQNIFCLVKALGKDVLPLIQVCEKNRLISKNTPTYAIAEILSAVSPLKDQAQTIITACKNNHLFSPFMSPYEKALILSKVAQLGKQADTVIQVFENYNLITEDMADCASADDIIKVISIVAQLGGSADQIIEECKLKGQIREDMVIVSLGKALEAQFKGSANSDS